MTAEMGKEYVLAKTASELQHVEKTSVLYGEVDVLAEVSAPSDKTLKEVMSQKLKGIANVRSTVPLIELGRYLPDPSKQSG